MEKIWLSICVATTIFIPAEMATVEITTPPTQVLAMKPIPGPDMKLGRAFQDSKDEKEKNKNTNNLISENKKINSTNNLNKSSDHPEIQNWPSVFVLKPDPTHPIVCYSGKSVNIHKNKEDDLEIFSIKDATTNHTNSSANNPKRFVLSSDPEYPVICQEVYIPSHSINNETAEEGNATIPKVTCIRRDYEKNISAIFINEVGPIQSAWNIFNSTIAYGVFNVENVKGIGEIGVLKDTVVNCEEYGVITGEKGLSSGTVASLLGVG